MKICLDQGIVDGTGSAALPGIDDEVGRAPAASVGFKLVLDEQWRGTAVGPSMRML